MNDVVKRDRALGAKARAILTLACLSACLTSCARGSSRARSHALPEVPRGAQTHADDAPSVDEAIVPSGSFLRGSASPTRGDEGPVHEVRLSAFAIDRTLVTRAAFARFVEATGYLTSAEQMGYGVASREGMDDWAWERVPHGSWRRPYLDDTPKEDASAFLQDDVPVVMVSWLDAVAYCHHRGARLPTEAEWEYAMRAGSSGTRFPWGNESTQNGRPGLNFWQGESHHHNDRTDGFLYVSPVRAFEPNALGIYDPVGNVWQWVEDFYSPDTYRLVAAGGGAADPKGPATGTTHVLRGGSWWCGACTCEGYGLDYRGKALPHAAFNNNGFRCARDVPQKGSP